VPRFSDFDSRGYRTVDVRSGYGEWVATYDATVEDVLDIELLEGLATVPWETVRRAADLGCGTGRTGAWLRSKGVPAIDGVDLTPEMLAVARSRGVYERVIEADVASTGLDTAAYDLVITCLVDEHLPDLKPHYGGAWRLTRPGGFNVLVAYHPHFLMATGIPTHFDSASGDPVAIETHVHLLSDHVSAGLNEGFVLTEMKERLIDDSCVELKPRWERFRNHPVTVAFVWLRPART
jgi:SAM-dependent methyltransferase